LAVLRGKTAIVRGAASGIGRATAELFADAGARLVLNDVDEERLDRLVETLVDGGAAQVAAVAGDVSDEGTAQALTRAAQDRFGAVDILVANAGIIPLVSIDQASAEDWDEVMAIDGRGMFLCCKHAIAAMRAAGGGSIVCVSSISGVAGQSRQSTYGPAKFVATGLTKHLAVECASQGIRVNAVAPGTIRTERVLQLADEPGGSEYLDTVAALHPMGRLGEPVEVAKAILFLASDDAAFITGAVLPVDGGYLAQ
jgi:NAD(P)-dependent dehydrogenase (short-subunit alcohol dehydrogenase family)